MFFPSIYHAKIVDDHVEIYWAAVMYPLSWDVSCRMVSIICQVMDEAMICYPSCLWDLGSYCKYATTVYLILEIVGNHELFWDYGCIAHNVF